MTIQVSLCLIVRDNKVLLLKKSEGLLGQRKWSPPGGKMLTGEDAERCAVREVLEETQLKIDSLEQMATIYFYKSDGRESPDWTVHVFLSRAFEGTPVGGREGIIKWFDVSALPFEEMWEDDQYWFKLAVEGGRFEGWFYYSGDFDKLVDYKLEKDRFNWTIASARV